MASQTCAENTTDQLTTLTPEIDSSKNTLTEHNAAVEVQEEAAVAATSTHDQDKATVVDLVDADGTTAENAEEDAGGDGGSIAEPIVEKEISAKEEESEPPNCVYIDKENGTEFVHAHSNIQSGVMCYGSKAGSMDSSIQDFSCQGSSDRVAPGLDDPAGNGAAIGHVNAIEATCHKDAEYGAPQILGKKLHMSDDAYVEGICNKIPSDLDDLKNKIEMKLQNGESCFERDLEISEEKDHGIAVVDVEKVLETQNTHDLYCPNCNSCITRRVILRRKRKVRSIHRKKKLEDSEIDIISQSNPDAKFTSSISNVAHETIEETVTQSIQEDDVDEEPNVFRCLSCFSFFIPTRNGAKLFPVSEVGVKNANTQDSQQITSDGNWFISIFSPGKKRSTDTGQDITHSDPVLSKKGVPIVGQESQGMVPASKVHASGHLQKYETIIPSSDTAFSQEAIKDADHKTDVPRDEIQGKSSVIVIETGQLQAVRQVEASNDAQSETVTQVPQETISASQPLAWDILKSIIYGGLLEAITSLGVVSSAVGAGAATWNIVAIGLANLIGGIFIIFHNLMEIKGGNSATYRDTLGRREKYPLHATMAILSFLFFGLMPPLVYGVSFYFKGDKYFSLAAVGGSSLVCIVSLAAGKAHVQNHPRSYLTTVMRYVAVGFIAAGASFQAGDLLGDLLEKLGKHDNISPSLILPVTGSPSFMS